jgi:putative acetyltransferase
MVPPHRGRRRADADATLARGARRRCIRDPSPIRVRPMPMRVRLADPQDRDALLALWERSVRATHAFLTEEDVVSLRPLVAEELASSAIAWWVLWSDDDDPIGFLGYTSDTIEALFVDPSFHRTGAGRFLVAHAERLSAGPLAVDVNEQNDAALRFYAAMGFTIVSRSPTDGAGRPFPLVHMRRYGA